jgi:hypothetical protein
VSNYFRKNSLLISKSLFLAFVLNLSASFLSALNQEAAPVEKKQSVYAKISDMHLTSVRTEDAQEKEAMQKLQEEADKAYNEMMTKLKFSAVKVPAVAEIEKLHLVYQMFDSSALANGDSVDGRRFVLNDNVFGDMQLYCGSMADLKHHVFGCVDRTQTVFGKIELQKFLYQEMDSIARVKDAIKQKQEIVRYLVNNPDLFKKIDAQLEIIRKNEADLLWFWKALGMSLQNYMNMFYFQASSILDLSKFNESTAPLEYMYLNKVGAIPRGLPRKSL